MICPRCGREIVEYGDYWFCDHGRQEAIRKEKEIWRPWDTDALPEQIYTARGEEIYTAQGDYRLCY